MSARLADGPDVEFERRFWVRGLHPCVAAAGTLIVQGYFVADGALSMRVRVCANNVSLSQLAGRDDRQIAAMLADRFTAAVMTVKAPIAAGARYEAERPLDPQVALALVTHAPGIVTKVRHTLPGSWFVDEFAGANQSLVVAEVEGQGPLEQVVVPAWVAAEVTDVPELANSALSLHPVGSWTAQRRAELFTAIDGHWGPGVHWRGADAAR